MAKVKRGVLPSHNFIVEIAFVRIPFAKIRSIEIGIETEVLMEGGENRYVYSLASPNNAEKILEMERIVSFADIKHKLLRVGVVFDHMLISVLDNAKKRKKMYVVSNVMLKKRTLSELDAMNGDVLVESLEFVYREITEII